ncbi:MAG: hypothetical protein LBE13_07275 [Bacteroidales bacterium]|jgi:phenylacetate-CoA ligase|nr:hypothetical protein [Bacteroidales bacterium]
MNKHFLKNIRDNMPEFLKYIMSPVFRNQLIKNKSYLQYKNLLYKRNTLTNEDIYNYQFDQLKEILIYSSKHIPYYIDLFKKINFEPQYLKTNNISDIPYLTKELIRENFYSLMSMDKVKGGYYIATTGGSTGEPLKVLLDYESIFKESAFVNFFREHSGYIEKGRLATFRGIEFGCDLWKFNPMHNELIFSPFKLSRKTIRQYVKKINEFNPDFLNGYLSTLYTFAKILEELNLKLKHPLKSIFLISENIDNENRLFVENFFQAPSSTFYGHSERCVIAEEIQPNEYVFDPYYGFTELIKKEDDLYEIIATGFLNRTMPLVRYKTNDLCRKNTNGSYSIIGRWSANEYLVGYNDEKIFHSAFNFHSEIFQNVINYQFLQNEKGKVNLLLMVNNQFNSFEINIMKKEIEKKMKNIIDFEIKIVSQFILTKRGKFNRFVSNLRLQ